MSTELIEETPVDQVIEQIHNDVLLIQSQYEKLVNNIEDQMMITYPTKEGFVEFLFHQDDWKEILKVTKGDFEMFLDDLETDFLKILNDGEFDLKLLDFLTLFMNKPMSCRSKNHPCWVLGGKSPTKGYTLIQNYGLEVQ